MHDFSAAPSPSACLPLTPAATMPGNPRVKAPMPPAWRSRRREIRAACCRLSLGERLITAFRKANGGCREAQLRPYAVQPFQGDYIPAEPGRYSSKEQLNWLHSVQQADGVARLNSAGSENVRVDPDAGELSEISQVEPVLLDCRAEDA